MERKVHGYDEFLDYSRRKQLEQYAERPGVIGLAEVMMGFRPIYAVTVYNISGDDTSGVAGLLKPDGEFLPAPAPRSRARYWEFDETFRYETTPEGRVVGNSWTSDVVRWDGSHRGGLNLIAQDGDREPAVRREWDARLTGEWMTTGELWRALERGTAQTGRVIGKIHQAHAGDDLDAGKWAA